MGLHDPGVVSLYLAAVVKAKNQPKVADPSLPALEWNGRFDPPNFKVRQLGPFDQFGLSQREERRSSKFYPIFVYFRKRPVHSEFVERVSESGPEQNHHKKQCDQMHLRKELVISATEKIVSCPCGAEIRRQAYAKQLGYPGAPNRTA